MELWDLYDKDGGNTGLLHMRDRPIPEGYYHLVVFIWTFTTDHKLLLTKRDPRKPGGNLWEVTAGSVIAGETSLEGASRELYEETGLSPKELHFFHRVLKNKGIYDHYIVHEDVHLHQLQLQEGETIDACLVHRYDFELLVDQNLVTKPVEYWYRLFEEELTKKF